VVFSSSCNFSGDTTACGNKPKSTDCGSSLRALRDHSQQQRQSKYELFVFFFIGAQRLTNSASDAGVKDYSKLGAL
jgi:hypothetical protein